MHCNIRHYNLLIGRLYHPNSLMTMNIFLQLDSSALHFVILWWWLHISYITFTLQKSRRIYASVTLIVRHKFCIYVAHLLLIYGCSCGPMSGTSASLGKRQRHGKKKKRVALLKLELHVKNAFNDFYHSFGKLHSLTNLVLLPFLWQHACLHKHTCLHCHECCGSDSSGRSSQQGTARSCAQFLTNKLRIWCWWLNLELRKCKRYPIQHLHILALLCPSNPRSRWRHDFKYFPKNIPKLKDKHPFSPIYMALVSMWFGSKSKS